MNRILLADTDIPFLTKVKARLCKIFDIQVDIASSLTEVRKFLQENTYDYAIANLDIHEAPEGVAISMLLSEEVPTIVLSCVDRTSKYEQFFKDGIIDYIFKTQRVLSEIIELLQRLESNSNYNILIVDDSPLARKILYTMLDNRRYTVFQAEDVTAALGVLSTTSIDLILTDYEMGNLSGFDLVAEVRDEYSREEMPIIGLSASGKVFVSAQFLKLGANDFLTKPYSYDELYCRVRQNLDMKANHRELEHAVYFDFLTNIHNRRYFFQELEKFTRVRLADVYLVMLDIDFFKKVNDVYGHDVGDEVLKKTAEIFKSHVKSDDILARLGGEEFALLLSRSSKELLLEELKQMRLDIASHEYQFEDKTFSISVSAGVVPYTGGDPAVFLQKSDALLYEAKEDGRNCIKYSES